ncbi:MAG: DNA repair protein RecN [Blastocatellia bacterium]|nr:DNA repair protein RecN [Blastocatellia bacterium]
MLRFLNISNLALIDRLQIEFKSGLNVLSGETGSGKSIIIDALTLLLGGRASQEIIRSGEERAFVEGVFEIEGNAPLIEVLEEAGIDNNGQELLIKREVPVSGRGRLFVNNQGATLALLRTMQPHLVDLHGQGDQQSLLSVDVHLHLLDAYLGAARNRQAVAAAYDRLLRVCRELEASRQNESERLQTLDMIAFQVTELEQAGIVPGEDQELETERRLLANAEKLATLCGEAYSQVYDDEKSLLARLGAVQRRVRDLADLDSRFREYAEQLESVKHTLDDLAFFLGDYAGQVQSSPERLQFVEDRVEELGRLKRKYGGSLEAALGTLAELRARREALDNNEAHIKRLEDDLKAALGEYGTEAEKLSRQRQGALSRFEGQIKKEFADVSLGAARFKVHLDAGQRSSLHEKVQGLVNAEFGGALRRTGNEAVEFRFSANPGEDLRPLSEVASGGELSRLMLVLKTITAPALIPKTLVFDEIDAGIGGKVADAVGARLKRLAETNQVLCVTHQVQLARHADAHFLVTKGEHGGRTLTSVAELDKQGRIEELARMIGGSEITPLARKHAQELLKTSAGR